MKKTIAVDSTEGFDTRRLAEIVQKASSFESALYLLVRNARINLKSIMGMMSLRLQEGDEITLVAEGTDAADAISGMETCFHKV